ncbi:hypothetical protein [Pseudonocardia alni]|uniref:hypothetical protein n=1 Tax=Pseudonocardia alni TaxID=33907 RepID=UPI003403C9A3
MTASTSGLPFRLQPDPPLTRTGGGRGRSGRLRRSRWRRPLGLVLLLLLLPVVVSYGRALTYPGRESVVVRTVEWVRDHGGAPIVDAVENLYYTELNAPGGSGPAAGSIPTAVAAVPAPVPPIPTRAGLVPLPGEGRWQPGSPVHGHPSGLLTTFIRPDPRHPGVVAGVARIDQDLLAIRLVPGTREPSGLGWPEGGKVPPGLVGSLVATFNSGWKMADAHGGFLADGRTAVALRDGAASIVVDKGGRSRIGEWGREVGPGPDVGAVRQNLDLVVDGGRISDGLDGNPDGRWGSAHNQLQYTWRSGVGVDARGDLIYVAGNQMNLAALAAALVQAGAVEGMQLDIHPGMANLFTYRHAGSGLTPAKLLPDMPSPTDRYLTADQRDFFAVTAR